MTTTSTINPAAAATASGFPTIPTRIADPSETQSNVQALPEVLERLNALEANLAEIHRVCSEAYVAQGMYEEALEHQRIAARYLPEETEYRNQLGFLRYLTGDDGAVEDFEFVTQNDPSNPEGHFNLAMIRFGQGDYIEAEKSFARAVELRTDDAEIWNNLGVARFQIGRAHEARQCFEQALAVNPEYADAQANLNDCTG